MDCQTSPSHITTVVSAPNFLNCFAFAYEVPIPWQDILTRHEKFFFGDLTCPSGLELILHSHCCLAEPQSWRLHCHCSTRHTLQCLAGRHVVKNAAIKFISGARFNKTHLWYREYVNNERPDEITYVGSIMYKDVHYVYLKLSFSTVMMEAALDAIKACLNPDMGFVLRGQFNYWVILKCIACPSSTYTCYRSCAVRTRAIVNRMLLEIEKIPMFTFRRITSRSEERRQTSLRRAMLHGRCTHVQSLSVVNLSAFLHF